MEKLIDENIQCQLCARMDNSCFTCKLHFLFIRVTDNFCQFVTIFVTLSPRGVGVGVGVGGKNSASARARA